MPPLAIAGVGLAVGGLGAYASAKSNKKAATTAANAATTASSNNNALARDMYGKAESYLAPYAQSGLPANALLGGAMGYGDQAGYRDAFKNFIGNSDYGFQFDQGANKVNSGYAGSGTLQSGAAMRGLEDYRQGLQSGYRGEFNSLLANQQSLGLGAGSALAGVGQNYTNTVSGNNNNAAAALGNAALIKAQNNPLANVAGMIGGGLYSYGMGL